MRRGCEKKEYVCLTWKENNFFVLSPTHFLSIHKINTFPTFFCVFSSSNIFKPEVVRLACSSRFESFE